MKPITAEMIQKFRNVFGTAEGHEVLDWILETLKFGSDLVTDEDTARHNAAVEILDCCGVLPNNVRSMDLMNQSSNWEKDYERRK